MTDQPPTRSKLSAAWSWNRANRHFLIAAAILAVAAAGWNVAVGLLQWAVYKEPVPWPQGVRVDGKEFRLLSLPKAFPDAEGNVRYALVEEDNNKDGLPDGEKVLSEEDLSPLGIGTRTDRDRLARRCSNWYSIRTYRDGRTRLLWRLEIYYYTGMLDTVPHTPERCLIASGATLQRTAEVIFHAPEGPWQGPVKFQRADYLGTDPEARSLYEGASYYIFSLNGRPEPSWELVRLNLTLPGERYNYFAKIQFGPLFSLSNRSQVDRAAEEFVRCSLPDVLRALPTAEDVRKLQDKRTG